MDRIVLADGQMMDFELLCRSKDNRLYRHPVIYFVLTGSLTVTAGDMPAALGEKDFLFVNGFLSHYCDMAEDALVMGFVINQDLISSYYDISKMEFVGNSTEGDPDRYRNLRGLLENCVTYYYGKQSKDGRILLKLNSIYYQIAEEIVASFTEVVNDAAFQGKSGGDEILIRDMLKFIQANYQSPIRLEELADRFYMSPSYISRLFKKKMGINFAKYLTDIRLDAAAAEMENTEKSLTHIAMDCGFPNLSSFNKAFREKYGMNPKQYRGSLEQKERNESAESEKADMAYRLLDYFEQNSTPLNEERDIQEEIEADTGSYTYLTRSWNRLINIGRIEMLLHTAIQQHVLLLKEELGFEYVRIWDLYDSDLRIHAGSTDKRYNFTRLDMALDFLVEHHLKPYIELGFKPNILLNNYLNYTLYEEQEIIFERGEDFGAFIHSLMIHLLNRYGMKEVSDWCFELWCDPRSFEDGKPDRYFDYFDHVYEAVKSVAPMVRVGGNYDRTYLIIDFEKFIQRWSIRRVQPDFFSVYCYTVMTRELDEAETPSYKMDRSNMQEYLLDKKDILLKYGMTMPLFISEWNLTVVNYNVLNDSRFKGAFTMKSIMDLYAHADTMGYWFGSDLFAEGDDPPELINGRCGLVTHQSICKPSFWAMKFMNRLENLLLAQSDHAMVTMNEFDSYVITCHNCRTLDIQYYVREENSISIDEIPSMYVDKRRLVLKIKITGVRNGLYHVKTRSVNSQHGGVQDEWIRMGKVPYLNQRDVDHIAHMSRPEMTIVEQMVTDGTIRLTAELEAQEIRCIHLFRYMTDQ